MNKTMNVTIWLTVLLFGMMLTSCETEDEPVKLPANITKFKATVLSSNQIQLTWTDNSDNEDGFRIERARFDSLYYTFLTYVDANVTSYTDTGLLPMTTYIYRIYAFNTAGNSRTLYFTGMTFRANITPNPPLQLRVVPVGDTKVYLSWQDNSSNEDGFKLERLAPGSPAFFGLDTVATNIDHYEDADLITNSTYQYRVRSYNEVGGSEYSNVVTIVPGTNVILPLAPSNLSAMPVSATQVELAWNDNSSNESSFKLERAPIATSLYVVIATLPSGTTNYRDKNLSYSTGYSYRVQATNSIGNSGYSSPADVITHDLSGPPNQPTNLRALIKSSTQIWLEWNDMSANEDGYYIERAPGLTSDFVQIATVVANETTYQAKGLSPSSSYSFRVRAFNQNGTSAYSNNISRTTPALSGTPAAPSRLTWDGGGITATYLRFKWTDNSANEDGFYIERAPGGTNSYVQIANVPAGTGSYTDDEVQQSTSYSYKVRAYNLAGTSSYTATITGTTLSMTETRFINGSSHAIVSLVVDGIEYLMAPQEIPVGSYLPIPLSAGRHDYSMRNGYWSGLMPMPIYSDTGQFIQQENVSGSVGFTDPTIYQVLTKFKYSGFWQAKYNSGLDSLAFRFFSDGTFFYYEKGFQKKTGLYSINQYNASSYTILFSTGDFEGTLSEQPGNDFFTMPNGPAGQETLTYYFLHP